MNSALKGKRHIHFVGIGGIGMSAIAQVLLKRGVMVSGSDIAASSITKKLEMLGASLYIGHKKTNVKKGIDLIVYSSCISPDNPELLEAKDRSIEIASRGAILAELMSQSTGIAVCGSHGKTTTSALIAVILTELGLDPTALIGGEVYLFASNARVGNGPHLVAEADESDGSFLKLSPTYSVITNIDEDHMDFFKDPEGLIANFQRYISNIKDKGCLIFCADDKRLKKMAEDYKGNSLGYGLCRNAEVLAKDVVLEINSSSFDCLRGNKRLGRFRINIPGLHNVQNCLAAISVALELKIDTASVKKALMKFTGTKRRFQIRGSFDGVMVVEDYAHHPSEIIATLNTARLFKPKRIVAVFQPHRFTRTLHLKDRFTSCFSQADRLIMTDIYSASERPIEGVTGGALCEEITRYGHKDASFVRKGLIIDTLFKIKKPGDMILVLGAGDINKIADELVKRWENPL